MKRIFTLIIVLSLCSKGFSQACKIMGCASNANSFGVQTGNPAQAQNSSGVLGGCYGAAPFRQVFWEFFFAPSGGDLVQAFTPTGATNGLELDWAVWDMSTSAPNPSILNCPADPNATIDPSPAGNDWVQIACNSETIIDAPKGPGVGPGPGGGPNVVTVTAGHYYALGVIIDDYGTGPSFDFQASLGTIGGVAMDASNCFDITLPIKLSSFGARVNNCVVNLNWVSESEVDFKSYEVESSVNGQNFKTVATITPSQPNVSSMQKYFYQDKNPPQGKVYYRLKMISSDGSFTYSNTIPLKLDCNKSLIVVYPNPVTDDILNVNVTNSNENATNANLFDSDGRLVYSNKLISGTNSIDMKKFPKGLYLLQLNNKGEKQQFKIIK